MSTQALDSDDNRGPAIPRRAVVFSVAVHLAALFLLPGLVRQQDVPEPPPIVATLRIPPAAAKPAPIPQATPSATRKPVPPAPAPRAATPKPLTQTARKEAPSVSSLPAPAAPPQPAVDEVPTRSSSEAVARVETSPAPVAVPSAVALAAEKALLDQYGRALSDFFAHHQQYPRLAALRGWEGEVQLRLKVARKGNLIGVQLVRSSGYEVLDQNALQMVQGASLPAPPEALGDREIQIVVPIHYKLRPA